MLLVVCAFSTAAAGQGFLLCEGGIGGCPDRTAGQRSSSLTPLRTESTWRPQPTQESLPHVQVTPRHIFRIMEE